MSYRFLNKIKAFLGATAHRIPIYLVPKVGRTYCGYQREIESYEKSSNQQEWVFRRVYNIVEYAINNIPFYQKFYADNGFNLGMLKSFEDIAKIPIITKQDLMSVDIEQRSSQVRGRYLVNTGGSTGTPLSFYKVYSLRVKEMAFFHMAWMKLGYRAHCLRLHFVGRMKRTGCAYDFSRNEIVTSVYEPFSNILRDVATYKVEFLQGYPSVLYEFALYCSAHPSEFENSNLKRNLKGIFLNSEYPCPLFRQSIENVFGVQTIAGFGHTEGAVLAFDFGDGLYHVHQSYGYAESVDMEDGCHLIGTTYDNFVSPLIRYDTNDVVDEMVVDNGILQSFKMTSGGRCGQYVVDANGRKISLTGLIFGKHHALFNYCRQLQVSQKEQGKATVYYVPFGKLPKDFEPAAMFDSSDINIEFTFIMIQNPIKTQAGKVLLMVKE